MVGGGREGEREYVRQKHNGVYLKGRRGPARVARRTERTVERMMGKVMRERNGGGESNREGGEQRESITTHM